MDGGDDCSVILMYLICLNCTLKNVYVVNFICILPHKIRIKKSRQIYLTLGSWICKKVSGHDGKTMTHLKLFANCISSLLPFGERFQ